MNLTEVRKGKMTMLENSLEGLLHGGPQVGLADSLSTIILTDMKPALLKEIGSLQSQLDESYTSGYARCDDALASDKGANGKLATKLTGFKKAQAQHLSCRKEEAKAQLALESCSDDEIRLSGLKEAACKVVADYNKANSSDCTKMEGETEQEYTARLQAYYEERNQKVKAAEEKCTAATGDYDNKVSECVTLKATWTSHREGCGTEQDTMDEASCDISEDELEVCGTYSRCYEQATTSYQAELKSIQSQVSQLKVEYKSLLRIQCLLKVFAAKDRATTFEGCKDQDFSAEVDSIISLRLPSPVPKPEQVCRNMGGAAANAQYVSQQYGLLPSNAPAKMCTASCCATCDEFLCPAGHVNIPDAKKKIGNLKEDCCLQGTAFPGAKLINERHSDLLKDWLKSSKPWTLCYQRSTHGGASPAAFHAHCDGKGQTVTVAKLSTGKVVGGWNANSWSSPTMGDYGTRSRLWDTEFYSPNWKRTGFVFSLTTEFKHYQNDRRFLEYAEYAAWNGDEMGPNFGLYHRGDLQFYSWEAGKRRPKGWTQNKCDIGYTYICRRGQTTERTCRDDFCGAFTDFAIEEMEVFYLK